MKKIIIFLLMIFINAQAYAALTVNNLPKVETGGTSPALKNSSISNPSSGNVGVNSTTPGQRLDVVGSVRATAFIGDGSQLTGISGGGGGVIGSDTQVPFNDAGTMAGNAGFIFQKTTGTVTATHFAGDGSGLTGLSGVSLHFLNDSSTTGNVTYVGCSDSIQTAITAANAGDTLILGSCTYSITSAINVTKSISIIGQGPAITVVDAGSSVISAFNITASGAKFKDFKVTGTGLQKAFLQSDSSTVQSLSSLVWDNIVINITASCPTGISLYNSQAAVKNSFITLVGTSDCSGQQMYGVGLLHNVNFNAARVSEIRNTIIDLSNTNASPAVQFRGIFHWNNGASSSASDSTLNIYNTIDQCYLTVGGSTVECLQNQGPNVAPNPGVVGGVYTNVFNSIIDGTTKNYSGCSSTNCRDYRIDDYAVTYFYNTSLGSNVQTSQNNSTIQRGGTLLIGSLIGDQPQQAPSSLSGQSAISLIGQIGGTKGGTGTTAGLAGGGYSLVGGQGGTATAATVTGTGGAGGQFSVTTGAGSDEIISSSVTNIGGAGGDIKLTTGVGGAANSAGTTNTGGRGGNIYLATASGGVGTSSNGAVGKVFIGVDSTSTINGNVSIGTTVTNAKINMGSAADNIYIGGNVGIGTITPLQPLQISSASTAGIRSINTAAQSSSGGSFIRAAQDDATVITAGSRLGGFSFDGSTTTAHNLVTGSGIEALATANWSGTSAPASLLLRTTPAGSLTKATVMTIDSTANVGIGTTIPGQKLDIIGSVRATAFIGDGSQLTGVAGGTGGWTTDSATQTTTTYNVGVGTLTPQDKLVVTNGNMRLNPGATAAEEFQMTGRVAIGIPVPYYTPTTNNTAIAFDIYPKGTPANFNATTGTAWIDTCSNDVGADNPNYECIRVGKFKTAAGQLSMVAGGSGVIRSLGIQIQGGNVGIGTTVPVRALSIDQSSAPSLGFSVSGVEKGIMGSASASNQFFTGAVAGDTGIRALTGNLFLGANTTTTNPAVTITQGTPGNVGIGTLTPGAKLDIFSGSIRDIGIGTTVAQQLCRKSDGTFGYFDGAWAGTCN